MKKIYLLFVLIVAGATLSAQTYTSFADGNWNDANTWDQSDFPNDPADIVVIEHKVTLTADASEVASISLSDTTFVLGSFACPVAGEFVMTGINARLIMDGSTFSIGTYFSQTDGLIDVLIGGGTIISAVSGEQPDDANNNLLIGSDADVRLITGATLTFNNNNGKSGNTAEVKIVANIASSTGDIVVIMNNKVGPAGDQEIQTESNFDELNVDIGTGNALTITEIAPLDLLYIPLVTVTSGSVFLDATTHLNCKDGFTSTSSDNHTIDGYLYMGVPTPVATLTLNSNIAGDGEVIATTYTLNGFSVFGVSSPTGGQKVSGGTWTGGASDWATATNWSQDVLPTDATNVDIPTGSPTVSGIGAVAKRISIQSGASLTIGSSGTLDVDQYIDNQAGATSLVIQSSDATGAGSLIHHQSLGSGSPAEPQATVQRYITDGAWHLVSSPTSDITTSNFYFDHSPGVWMQYFTENDNNWHYMKTLDSTLTVGQGYAIWIDDAVRTDVTVEFTGDLLSEDFASSATYSGTSPDDPDFGWNLIGNPFSSAFELGPERGWGGNNNVEPTVWVWDQTSQNYLYWVYPPCDTCNAFPMPNGIIPMAQGFFVKANGDAPSFNIPEEARVHSSQPFYKGSDEIVTETDMQILYLEITNELATDYVYVGFGQNGTTGFEDGFDISKLRGNAEAPQLYLVEEEREQSINYLSELSDERTVVMNFEAGINGNYEMTSAIENMDGVKITLEDLKTGVFHNLTKYPVYAFKGLTTDNPDRFRIHFKYLITDVDDPIADANDIISVYSFDKKVYIRNNEPLNTEMADVMIYDLYGRELYRSKITLGNMTEIPVSVNNSYLVVKVAQGNQAYTQKVFVK